MFRYLFAALVAGLVAVGAAGQPPDELRGLLTKARNRLQAVEGAKADPAWKGKGFSFEKVGGKTVFHYFDPKDKADELARLKERLEVLDSKLPRK